MSAADLRDVVEGRRPVEIVARDARHIAFLAERPVRPGHVIVATTQVVDGVFDLDADAAAGLWAFVHATGRRLRERLPCARVCISVIGWAVRHAHVHLVPTDAAGQVSGLDGAPLEPAVARTIAERLRA
jgi:histidine triad (HIT) family protein